MKPQHNDTIVAPDRANRRGPRRGAFALATVWLAWAHIAGITPATAADSTPPVASVAAAATTAKELEALPAKALVERVEAALAARGAILTKRRTLTERLAPIDKDLQAQAVERQAFVTPEAPDMSSQPTDPKAAQELVDGLSAVAKALEQRITVTGNQATLAGQHRETALLLAQEVETLAESGARLAPLLNELARRSADGSLKAEELPDALKTTPEIDDPAELAATAAAWRAEAERDQVMIRSAKDERAGLEKALEAARADVKTATLWLAEATKRAALLAEFSARGVADLISVFNVRLAEANDQSAALKERLEALSAKQNALNEAGAALDTMKPREVETADATGTPEGLRRARAALAAAEAAKAFQSERLERIGQVIKDTAAQREALAADLAVANKLLDERIALEVLAEALRTPPEEPAIAPTDGVPGADAAAAASRPEIELPVAATDGSLPVATHFLRAQVTQLAEVGAALEAREAALAKAREAAEVALEEADKAIEDQTRAVEQEGRWASFITAVESLPADELGETFEGAVKDVAANQEKMTAAAAAAGETGAAIDAAAQALAGHHDPVTLAMSGNDAAFLEWRKARDLVVAEKAATPAAAIAADGNGTAIPAAAPSPGATTGVAPAKGAAVAETPGAANATASAGSGTAAAKPVSAVERWLAATRDLRDQTVARRLTFLKEDAELRTAFATALAAHELKLGEEIEATEAALEAARRAWGAASTLRVRLGEATAAGGSGDPALAEAIKPWLERARVTALQDKVAALRGAQAKAAKQRESLSQGQTKEELVEPLAAWADLLTSTAETLTEVVALRAQFAQLENIEKLDELERRMLEREINHRISQDQGVYRNLGTYFGSQETGTIDELLSRYYTRLVVLERRIANVDKRQEHLAKVIELTERQREVMGELKTVLAKVATEDAVRLDVAGTRVRAALFPAKAAELLTGLKDRTGVEVALTDLPKITVAEPAAVSAATVGTNGAGTPANGAPANGADAQTDALMQARRELVNGLKELWAAAMGYRAWDDQVAAAIEPLGVIDANLDAYRSQIAELETAKEELRRTVHRLSGYAPSEMRGLVAGSERLAEGAALGEIGLLQRERRQLLESRFLESIVSLVIIPVGAFILILITGRFGRRMFLRPTRPKNGEAPLDPAQQRERETRARTLFGIFHKTISTIIILLAIVYMLQVVNIDVTPIIASFGVFGLAVAFGAQAVMRDVFAGFFLLLENQLNRGDWVTINGLMGEVENIGLRMTTVRDYYDGQLHFIPNGQIRVVSNYNKEWSRVTIIIELPFSVDSDMAVGVLKRIATEMMEDPALSNLKGGGAKGGIAKLNHKNGTQGFMIQLDVLNADFSIGREYRRRAKMAFEALGIPLGMPHQVVRYLPDDAEWDDDAGRGGAIDHVRAPA